MIKLSKFEEIVKKHAESSPALMSYNAVARGLLGVALSSGKGPFVLDIESLIGTGTVDPQVFQYYANEGVNVLNPIALEAKKGKGFDPTSFPQSYLFYTGLLNNELLIGIDRAKDKSSDLYTRNLDLLNDLYLNGAFPSAIDSVEFKEILDKLDKKLGTAIPKQALALARLDLSEIYGDKAEFKITLPNFRDFSDVGNVLKFYPYYTHSDIGNEFIRAIGSKMGEIQQLKSDGSIKTRKVTASPKTVQAIYKGYDKDLVDGKVRKYPCQWSPTNMKLSLYNLESSLYSIGHTVVELEDLISLREIKQGDIDKTQHLVDYNLMKQVVLTRINSWNTTQFNEFKGLDLSSFATIADKKEALLKMIQSLEDKQVYTLVKAQPDLFKDIDEGMTVREKQNAKEFKQLQPITLPDDPMERVKKLKELLDTGLVSLTVPKKTSLNPETYLGTRNKGLLKKIYGEVKYLELSDVRTKIYGLVDMITDKGLNSEQATEKLYQLGLTGNVDMAAVASNKNDIEKVKAEILKGIETIQSKAPSSNPYIVNFSRAYLSGRGELFAAVDVRKIEYAEYAPIK